VNLDFLSSSSLVALSLRLLAEELPHVVECDATLSSQFACIIQEDAVGGGGATVSRGSGMGGKILSNASGRVVKEERLPVLLQPYLASVRKASSGSLGLRNALLSTVDAVSPIDISLFILLRCLSGAMDECGGGAAVSGQHSSNPTTDSSSMPTTAISSSSGASGGFDASLIVSPQLLAEWKMTLRETLHQSLGGRGLNFLSIYVAQLSHSLRRHTASPVFPLDSRTEDLQGMVRLQALLALLEEASANDADNISLLVHTHVPLELVIVSPPFGGEKREEEVVGGQLASEKTTSALDLREKSYYRPYSSSSSSSSGKSKTTANITLVSLLTNIIEWCLIWAESQQLNEFAVAGTEGGIQLQQVEGQQRNVANDGRCAEADIPVIEVLLACLRVLVNVTHGYSPGCKALYASTPLFAEGESSTSTSTTTLNHSGVHYSWGIDIIFRVVFTAGQVSLSGNPAGGGRLSPILSFPKTTTAHIPSAGNVGAAAAEEAVSVLASAQDLQPSSVARFDALVLSLGLLTNCVEKDSRTYQALCSGRLSGGCFMRSGETASSSGSPKTCVGASAATSPAASISAAWPHGQSSLTFLCFLLASLSRRLEFDPVKVGSSARFSPSLSVGGGKEEEEEEEGGEGEEEEDVGGLHPDDVIQAAYISLLLGCCLRCEGYGTGPPSPVSSSIPSNSSPLSSPAQFRVQERGGFDVLLCLGRFLLGGDGVMNGNNNNSNNKKSPERIPDLPDRFSSTMGNSGGGGGADRQEEKKNCRGGETAPAVAGISTGDGSRWLSNRGTSEAGSNRSKWEDVTLLRFTASSALLFVLKAFIVLQNTAGLLTEEMVGHVGEVQLTLERALEVARNSEAPSRSSPQLAGWALTGKSMEEWLEDEE